MLLWGRLLYIPFVQSIMERIGNQSRFIPLWSLTVLIRGRSKQHDVGINPIIGYVITSLESARSW